MKTFMTAAFTAAALFVGGAASAATYTPDEYLFETTLGNSGEGTETDALKGWLVDKGLTNLAATVSFDTKLGGMDWGIDDAGNYFADVDPGTPGYFMLKFGGGGNFVVNTHYFFRNVAEMTKLVWTDADVDGIMTKYCTTAGASCRLSHITVFDGNNGDNNTGDPGVVPLPATGLLLLGGLGGLAALRKRRKSA